MSLIDALVRGESLHTAHEICSQEFNKLETLRYHMVKTRNLYLTWA